MSNFGANHPKDMSNINDKATVSLFVNGEQAEDAMKRLSENAAALKTQLEAAMAAGDKKSAKSLQRELDKVNKELNRTESAAKGTNIVLDNLANSSIHGLRNALKYLEKELRMTKPNTEQWEDYAEKIKLVKQRLNELSVEEADTRSLWDKFKSWSQDAWPALDLLGQWGGNVVDIMRGAVDAFAQMEQEMANVRKFTGMTEEQVADLNDEFKKIDTRTSREDLNKLAQEAGRLGKTSKEDILGFVRAADQINVALDDLGEGATLTLSKLTGVFGDEARFGTEQSLLKVGSVINELSQNCSASAPYLAQFASRMGGVGAQAKMTIPQIMAFGAVLDSNGQAVEASATALSQVIVRMMQEPAKYAKVAGLDVKQFSDLLKTDVNGALILFLDTLQKAGGMDVLSPMFKDMGENGSRAIAALSTLATHIDTVKAQQVAANEAFDEGISVTREAAVQNGTVQAQMEKAAKSVNDLRVELGEKLQPLMSHIISSSSMILRMLVSLVRFLLDNKTAVLSLAAGIAAYTVTVNLATIKTVAHAAAHKLMAVYLAAERLIFIAISGAIALFSGNITRATASFKLFSLAIKANPIGLVVSAITTAVAAIGGWIYKVNEARKAEREQARERAQRAREFRQEISDTSQKSSEYARDELARLKRLYDATQNHKKSQKERLAAVKELQKTYPTAFGNLSREEILAGKAAAAYDALAKNIIKAARAEAAKDKIKENEGKLLDLEMEREDLEESLDAQLKKLELAKKMRDDIARKVSAHGKMNLGGASDEDKAKLAAANKIVAEINAGLDETSEKIEEIMMKSGEIHTVNESLSKRAADATAPIPGVHFGTPSATPTPSAGETTPPPSGDGIAPSRAAQGGDSPAKERFEEEKIWRARQEAEARIAYLYGQTSYSEHMARMVQIEADYYQKILDNERLSEEEAIQIRTKYWNAVNKGAIASTKYLLEDEKNTHEDILLILRQKHAERLSQENLSAEERKKIEETYEEEIEMETLQHLKYVASLYKEGSQERRDAQRKYDEAEVAAKERHLKKAEDLEQKYAQMKEKFFGDNPSEKQANYERDLAALQVVYNRELAAAQGNADERLRIEKAFQQAKRALQQQYDQESEEGSTNSYKKAIQASVDWLNSDGGKALTQGMSTMVSGMSEIFSGLTSMIQAELEIQTAQIERKYDREIELAQGNSYKVAKLEKMKEKEIAKAKNEANKKAFAMQILQAVAQTAMNALAAYGSASQTPIIGHILAPIAAAMAVAAGAIQIATIKKQQQASEAQGYAQGGFTRPGAVNEPAGIVHAGEWVASQKLLSNPVARPMIEALDYAQRTNTIGSLRAEDVSRSLTANNSLVRIAESDTSSALLAGAAVRMSQTADTLTQRLNEPFITVNTVTGDVGIKRAQDEYTRLMNNITPKSKRK